MVYLHRKKSNKSTNWKIFNKYANSVIKLLNVTQLMHVGQTRPTWTIFRSPTFNFSREFFKTCGISNFKRNNVPYFSCKIFQRLQSLGNC